MATEVTDEDLEALWKDKTFPGHYSGIAYFQHTLEMFKGIKVSQQRIRGVLNKIRNYEVHVRKNNKGPRRHYIVHSFGELTQGDLAVMWKQSGYQYFVLVTDVYSMNIYTRSLKTKTAKEMKIALEEIFTNDMKMYPSKFETDQGGEFEAKVMKDYYLENKIYYKTKFGHNKASVAENAIYVIKRKLYMMLRQFMSKDWVKYLPVVTESLNLQPRPALGYLSPSQVTSPVDDPTLERAKKMHHVPQRKELSVEEMIKNQKHFDNSNSPFQPGKYVYKNFLPNAFDKSYDTQESIIFCFIIYNPYILFFCFARPELM